MAFFKALYTRAVNEFQTAGRYLKSAYSRANTWGTQGLTGLDQSAAVKGFMGDLSRMSRSYFGGAGNRRWGRIAGAAGVGVAGLGVATTATQIGAWGVGRAAKLANPFDWR